MPTPLRVAAEVIVDAEPEVTWRAAVDWPRQVIVPLAPVGPPVVPAPFRPAAAQAGAAGLMPVPMSKD
jgi:hypothetical protein